MRVTFFPHSFFSFLYQAHAITQVQVRITTSEHLLRSGDYGDLQRGLTQGFRWEYILFVVTDHNISYANYARPWNVSPKIMLFLLLAVLAHSV